MRFGNLILNKKFYGDHDVEKDAPRRGQSQMKRAIILVPRTCHDVSHDMAMARTQNPNFRDLSPI